MALSLELGFRNSLRSWWGFRCCECWEWHEFESGKFADWPFVDERMCWWRAGRQEPFIAPESMTREWVSVTV